MFATFNDEQLPNAFSPILVTLLPMVTEVRREQPSNLQIILYQSLAL
jgi:hypothetical protein